MHLSFKRINDNMKKGPVLQTLTTMGIATWNRYDSTSSMGAEV